MNGAPKQVEKVGCGSVTPRSVPATLEVKPERKWYIACAGVSRAIGGSTPKASQVSMTTFFGCAGERGRRGVRDRLERIGAAGVRGQAVVGEVERRGSTGS